MSWKEDIPGGGEVGGAGGKTGFLAVGGAADPDDDAAPAPRPGLEATAEAEAKEEAEEEAGPLCQ